MNMFNIFLITWVLIGFITFIYLFYENAPYGRHIKSGWGKKIPARLGWVLMESPCVYLMIILSIIFFDKLNTVNFIFLFLWLMHYVHRTFIYPFLVNMDKKEMPITIPLSALFFNHVNVSIQFFGIFIFSQYSIEWLASPTFLIGTLIFVLGMFINIKSDYLMIALRKEKGSGYHIPNKFLYKYISSPNYFGEMIEWAGWAILTWSSAGAVFLIWTIANLFPRAIAHHKWYQDNFDNYPKNRKAVIPGII